MDELKTRTQVGMIVFVSLCVLVALFGALLAWQTLRTADRALRDELLRQASTVAEAIDPREVAALTGTEADLASPVYLRLKEQLRSTAVAFPKCRFLYLMGRRADGTIFFYVDSEPPGSPDESPPGQVYTDASEEDHRVFDTGRAETYAPYTDAWGTWVSVSIPITDPASGKVIAVFGMDVDAKEWQALLKRSLIAPLGFVAALLLTILGSIALLRWRASLPFERQGGWLPRYLETLITATFVLVVSGLLSNELHTSEEYTRREVFSQLARAETTRIRAEVQAVSGHYLEGLARFFTGSQYVTGEEFHTYASPLKESAIVTALKWVRLVRAEERAGVEKTARQEGLTEFIIWEKGPGGERIPALPRDVYYPILYLESREGVAVSMAPGYDVGTEPQHLAALQEAARSRMTVATEPTADSSERITLYLPVFGGDGSQLYGFVGIEVTLPSLFRKTIAEPGGEGLEIVTLDLYRLRYDGPPVLVASTLPGHEGISWPLHAKKPVIIAPLFICGKTYALVAHPGPTFTALYPIRGAWLIMSTGVLTTIILAALIGMLSNRRFVLEQRVRQRTAELQESEARYRRLAENAEDLIYRYEFIPQRGFTYVSPSATAITGYTPEEHYADPDLGLKIVHPDDRPLLEQYFQGKGVFREPLTLRWIRKDGEIIWTEQRNVPIYDADGNIIAIEGIARDITKRKQAEEELRRRSNELSLLYSASQILARILDPEAIGQRLIEVMEQLIGYEYGAVLVVDEATQEIEPLALSDQGRGIEFVKQDKEYVRSKRLRVGQGIVGWVIQHGQPVRVGDVSRDPRYFAMREEIRSELCVPLMVGERVIGALNVETSRPNAYNEDDQRLLMALAGPAAVAIENARLYAQVQKHAAELEQRVRERTAQLEAANRELEAFAFSVSHDLRAPLRAIRGFSAALAESYLDHLDAQGRHYLELIEQAADQMSQLIDAMLALSRVTRREMIGQEVDLSALAREIAAELQRNDPHRQAEFIIAEGLVVWGDVHLLRTAMQNLLENAWKFTAPRSTARIEVGMVERDGERIYFVRDNGVGFDMTYADKLFAPFQRLHSASEFPGTGIGLATVQRIVARHGGRIWVEAAVEQGAVFYFTLPGHRQ